MKLYLLLTALLFSITVYSVPLNFVGIENYPPFSWQENGELKGIYVDKVRAAAQLSNAFKLLDQNRIDAFIHTQQEVDCWQFKHSENN